MGWLKSIIGSYKSTLSRDMKINNQIVIFSGLFSYSVWEKSLIQKRTYYKKAKFNTDLVDIIKSQYYPVFGKFILNDSPNDYLEIESSSTYTFDVVDISGTENKQVILEDIKLSFFDDTIGLGIYSFSVKLPENISFAEDIRMLRILRDFESEVRVRSTSYSLREFIQLNILRCEDNVDTAFKMNIDSNSDVFGYSGSKLKSFIAVEIDEFAPRYTIEEALYELGTFTEYLTSKQNVGSHSPSSEYFDSILSNQISVFQNWSALALFDSFILIGKQGYLKKTNTVSTIRGSYFKIFLFNLYSKFYLFKTNSDIETNKRKEITHTLYSFLRNYDISYISFNFLPNLLHEKIRTAFQIHSELNSVRSKIELMESQKKEKETNLINALLFFIAALGIVSVLADLPAVLKNVFNNFNEREATFLGVGLVFIALMALVWYFKIFKSKR
ncbi:hypothetical protein [Sphingobacterium wenxiniae]|uniref:CorA-like Mg2+ transporter protein n=1 Tax=Sphingobacterium wenxiniae TaxID=683125 RepID=A0A1I6TH92_9SPHI|nr:hypothetical protein [Sphingobacterium wenxiniae]SFS88553.1 hypothetical protein SAMN05660206_106149 [Sphingobacterium wenxiniae]